MLGAGNRNRQAAFYNVTDTTLTDGTNTRKHTLAAGPIWCNVKVASTPRESEIAKAFTASEPWIITILYREDITHKQIAVIDGEFFSIEGVTSDETNSESYVYCTKLLGQTLNPIYSITTAGQDGRDFLFTFNQLISLSNFSIGQFTVTAGTATLTNFSLTQSTPSQLDLNVLETPAGSMTYAITGHTELTNPTGSVVAL